MKTKRFLLLILPLITLVLEALPFGAVCNFANPDGEPFRFTYSYFSLTPFGYAHFSPFLTALLTSALLILVLIFCFTGNSGLATASKIVACASFALSLCPLVFGISFFSVTGAFISLSLLLEAALLLLMAKARRKN